MLVRELSCSTKTGGGTRILRGAPPPLPTPLATGLWSGWSQFGEWKSSRIMEEGIYGKDEFWAWSGGEKKWWMMYVVMKEMINWSLWEVRVIGIHDQQVDSEVP